MERQPIMFVAGPYRAPSFEEIEFNVLRAAEWAGQVKLRGWTPLCPHTNSHAISLCLFLEFGPAHPSWLKDSLALLERCDGLLLIPGWEGSEGAVGEREFAKANDIIVFDWQDFDAAPEHGGVPKAEDFWEYQRKWFERSHKKSEADHFVDTNKKVEGEPLGDPEQLPTQHLWDKQPTSQQVPTECEKESQPADERGTECRQ